MKNVEWVPVLRSAAQAGKKAILRNYDLSSRNKIVKRGVGGDMTLRIDEASETAIYDSLKKQLGKESFVFLSEEIGEVNVRTNTKEPVIVCDPLDGSHNAQVGIPLFAVALSVIMPKNHGRSFDSVIASIILSIKTDDEYTAEKGKGAYHNGKKLERRKSSSSKINTLLVETGDVDYFRERILEKLTSKEVYKTRLLGSAALSLCLLADGSADAMIFAQPGGARTIDSPAGYLIATEAGCTFSDLTKHRKVSDIEVGFDSRVDLLGTSSPRIYRMLEKRLGQIS
ncbi:MAG: hypothetical protein OK457_02515 [Thaumarchaeota archaeon]|nr:hypothetical protein [Nitrososphaerota archaeon]